jgi:signal peptidase I
MVIRRYAVAAATVALFAALSRGRAWPPVSRYIVDGPSMEPAYRNGDRLLVNRLAYIRHAPSTGDVVVLRDPRDRSRLLLKRVAPPPDGTALQPNTLYVLGDNAAESRDSREFGAVPRSLIVGRAWRKY